MYIETTQIQTHGCKRAAAELADIHTAKKVFATSPAPHECRQLRSWWQYVQPAVKIMFWRHYYAHKIIKIEGNSRLNDKSYIWTCTLWSHSIRSGTEDRAAYHPRIKHTSPFSTSPHLPHKKPFNKSAFCRKGWQKK